mgnify:CR=1 FL=1
MINLLVNATKGRNLFVMLRKLTKRLENSSRDQALKWAIEQAVMTTDDFCKSIDESLYVAVRQEILDVETKAESQMSRIGLDLGGGGNYHLLYFLVRKLRPINVVETGVAAGWSSLAILKALDKNKCGKLYSSDFPYFRLKRPEQFIGILVQSPKLRERWHLDIRGDEVSLPNFRKLLGKDKIQLFHYDSDKSYSGRKFALKVLQEKI